MSLTRARIIQYIGILLALGALAAGYWYFSARASTKVNKTATSSLTSGLVGYWTFDGADVSGTTATDRSGSGNNGTLTNGPTKAIGKIGQGLSFTTGTTQHVNAGSATSLDNIVQKTICAWVLPRSYDISTVSKEFSNYTSGWNFSVDLTSRALYYYSYFGSANGEWRSASNSITLNRWQHWCVSYNNSSALNDPIFYIDSVLSPTTEISTPSGTVADDSGENLIIGNTDETNNQASDGSIDDVRIYNRALSAAEIAGLYDMDKVKVGTRPGDDALEEGLAGYWKLDENTGTSAADATGNGSTGTLTGGPTWSTGKIGSAVTFDGTDDYIEMGNVTVLNSLTRVTASAWVKTAIGTGERHIFDKSACNGSVNTGVFEFLSNYVGTGRPSFAIYKNGGTPEVYLADSTARIDDNTWHLVTGVYDGANAIIYVDGVNTGQTAAAGITLSSTTNTLQIGGNCNGNGTFEWNGSIDEVRAYTRALSPDEVALLYRETHPDDPDTNLVGHWTFDGMDVSGTTVLDRGRGGNRGTLTNGPTVTPGRLGQALNFDGTDDKVNCGDTTTLRNLEDQGGGGMTVMAWIKPRSAGGSGGKGHIVSKENNDSGPGDGEWGLSLLSTSNRLLFGHSRATQSIAAYADNAWATNTWQHVAVTFNGGTVASTAIHIYANGTELSHAYDQDGSGAYSTDATANLLIGGGYSAGNGWNFDGLIDDVRVYNRVLSATEIAALYKSSGGKATLASSGNDTLRSGLVGQWSMDGQDFDWSAATTEVKDRSGNANHGDATNMSAASVGPGRVGQALNFDGVNDYVTLGDPVALRDIEDQGGGGMSISAWIKPRTAGGSGKGHIVGKSNNDSGAGDGSWGLSVDTSSNRLSFAHSRATQPIAALINNGWVANQWEHIVVTFNGGTVAATAIQFYIDGALQGTHTYDQDGSGAFVSDAGNTFFIGAGDTGGWYFDGAIDDVRVYNRVITASEVTQLYNLGR